MGSITVDPDIAFQSTFAASASITALTVLALLVGFAFRETGFDERISHSSLSFVTTFYHNQPLLTEQKTFLKKQRQRNAALHTHKHTAESHQI